ncbi:MAG: phospholipase D-like domain-containing protein [Halobacteriota archaeon]
MTSEKKSGGRIDELRGACSQSYDRLKVIFLAILILILIIGIAFNVEGTGTANSSAPGMSEKVIITEIYYNTYLKGDTHGEFIRIHNPTESSINIGGWQITDVEGVITFPSWLNIDAGDSLYLAYNATAFYEEMLQNADFEHGVDSDSTPNMGRYKTLILANNGDEVILKDEKGEIIDVVIYGNSVYAGAGWSGIPVKDTDEGVILARDRNETTGQQYEDRNSSADWDDYRVYVVGQSYFPYKTFNFRGNVTVFTSPDSSFNEIANAIDTAEESIYLNVYQFHNFYLMDHIIEAIERGVEVKIMLEGDPVNGIADEERYIANQTVTAGGEVRFMIDDKDRGIHDRYAFNHAKYALIDNKSTIVMSENWKNTGVPTNNTFGNRGWGVIINNSTVTNYFSAVFFEDWKPASRDSFPFTSYDPIYGNKYGSPPPDFVSNRTIPTGNYSPLFNSEIISGEFNISPVLAPDTSLMQAKSIIGMIKGAKKSVYVEQLYIYKDWGTYAEPEPNQFLEAALNASRRGCEVKILLDSRYGKEHNEETIKYVNDIAKAEKLNLKAKLIDNEAIGLNKTHNKGVIVDQNRVLTSSINWNEYSPRNNREVGLLIENEDAAEFYTNVFLYDWHNIPPVVSFRYSPLHPVLNQSITFDASNSFDSDGTIANYNWDFGDGNITNTTEAIITHAYSETGDSSSVNLTVADDDGAVNSISKLITVSEVEVFIFDTGSPANPYPSIFGTHNGIITPSQAITVQKFYTYPCPGTGGHSECVEIWNNSWSVTATWDGYKGDWHNITFDEFFTLKSGETYNYTIHTGSYPQNHHTPSLLTANGWINCTSFLDANGRICTDWIPAVKLYA